jgi:hypothetical protein
VFKRTVWFTVGAATGLGSSWWVQRRVRQAAAQLPERVQREVTDAARRRVGDVRAAASEGRAAMQAREAELRSHVEATTTRRTPVAPASPAS